MTSPRTGRFAFLLLALFALPVHVCELMQATSRGKPPRPAPLAGVLDWIPVQSLLADLTGDGHVDLLCLSQTLLVLSPTTPRRLHRS